MPKIAIIGAGGVIFARRFITDILLRESLRGSQLALMDISAERLGNTVAVTRKIGEALGLDGAARGVVLGQDRRFEALSD